MKKNLLLLIVFILSTQIYGQTTMENFSYGAITGTAADTLTNPIFGGNSALGNAKWRTHSGSGGQIVYSGTSLSFPGYTSSGIGGSVGFTFATGSRQDANRSVAPISSGNAYVSFLLKMTGTVGATGDYFFHIMDTSFITAFRARLFVKNGSLANTYNLGISKGTTTVVYSPTDYKIDSTVLVVLKYSFNATVNDTVYAYAFTGSTPTVEPSVAQMIASDISQGDLLVLNSVAIRQGTANTATGIIDGIRVSTSWANGVLPVKFGDFSANVSDNLTNLSWTSISELNNSGFEIERSIDGENFEKIGFVKGAGTSNVKRNYKFEFNSDASAFYRLKQVDFDGNFEYSSVIATTKQLNDAVLTPNPFNNIIQLSSGTTIQKVEIVDLMGKVVLTETINNNSATLNANELLNGVYFIKVYQGETSSTRRIIKTN